MSDDQCLPTRDRSSLDEREQMHASSVVETVEGSSARDAGIPDVRETRTRSYWSTMKSFNLRNWLSKSLAFYLKNPAAASREIFSGVTLALIEVPESVAFAFMANVDPTMGMAAVFWVGTITGLMGGRPPMISGAAGAMTVVLGGLTKDGGPLKAFPREFRIEMLKMTVFLIGVFDLVAAPIVCAFAKVIPQTAMIGFMNALAIIISKAQVDTFKICSQPEERYSECTGQKIWLSIEDPSLWTSIALIVITLIIMWGMPKLPSRLSGLLPSSLVAIVLGSAVEWGIFRQLLHIRSRTVAESAPLASGIPGFHWPSLPSNTPWTPIITYAISVGLIGLIETVMTHEMVNSLVKETPSSFASNQECYAQGLANLLCGVFGAVGGSALVGETVINYLHGARVTAGLSMLIIIQGVSKGVGLMPVATLAGIIFTVAIHTFQWKNLLQLHRIPRPDAFVILVTGVGIVKMGLISSRLIGGHFRRIPKAYRLANTMYATTAVVTAVSVATNLAIGILFGSAFASLWHVWRSGGELAMSTSSGDSPDGRPLKVYRPSTSLFFATSQTVLQSFGYEHDPDNVVIDMRTSSLKDLSAMFALNEAGKRYMEAGKQLTLIHLDPTSLALTQRCKEERTHLKIVELPRISDSEQGE